MSASLIGILFTLLGVLAQFTLLTQATLTRSKALSVWQLRQEVELEKLASELLARPASRPHGLSLLCAFTRGRALLIKAHPALIPLAPLVLSELTFRPLALFPKQALSCERLMIANRQTSLQGTPYTADSVVAEQTCVQAPFASGVLSANLSLPQYELSSETTALGVLGAFEASQLTLNHDASIVSAGDITIGNIHANYPVHVNVWSQTGTVRIGSVDNSVTLKIASFKPPLFPTNTVLEPITIEVLSDEILGIPTSIDDESPC